MVDKAKQLVDEIIEALNDYQGFDDWMHEIEDCDRIPMIAHLVRIARDYV